VISLGSLAFSTYRLNKSVSFLGSAGNTRGPVRSTEASVCRAVAFRGMLSALPDFGRVTVRLAPGEVGGEG
jgi:hypothetical protein